MSADTSAPTGTAREIADAAIKPIRFGTLYVAEHRIRAMRAYLQTIVVTSLGNPLVYLFGLGVGLARLVTTTVDGATYLEFVAPALLASAAVTVAANEFTYPIMAGFKWNPIYFGMNAAPISATQIVNGQVLAISAHMSVTVIAYFLFMLLFGAVPSALGVLAIVVAIGAGLAVGMLIMAYCATIVQDRGQPALLQRFGIMPMFLFSGTFFPITSLPLYLQWIGWISPLWHATQLGRVVSYGLVEPAWLTVVHILYLVALGVLGWRLAQRSFRRRLNS